MTHTNTSKLAAESQSFSSIVVLDRYDYRDFGDEGIQRLTTDTQNPRRCYIMLGTKDEGYETIPINPNVSVFLDTRTQPVQKALMSLWQALYDELEIPWKNFMEPYQAYEYLEQVGIATGATLKKMRAA